MLLLDSLSQFAPLAKWLDYADRLRRLDPANEAVAEEKARTLRIITLLQQPAPDANIPD